MELPEVTFQDTRSQLFWMNQLPKFYHDDDTYLKFRTDNTHMPGLHGTNDIYNM